MIIYRQKLKISSKPYKYSDSERFNLGIVVVDKPKGWLSRKASRKLKNLVEVVKSGHAGTLDPAVTGVLPIFLQKGTKLTGVMSIAPKRYHGWMKINKEVTKAQIEKARKHFTGKIKQLPPKISAVKRVLRVREIYSFKILKINGRDIEYDIQCEAGTYIRKLCHDFGEFLKTGGHMTKLERTEAGPFTLKDTITFDKIKAKYQKKDYSFVRPIEDAVGHLNKVWVDDKVLPMLKNGSPVFSPGVVAMNDKIKVNETVAIFTRKNQLAAIGLAEMNSADMKKSSRGMAVKTDIVLL